MKRALAFVGLLSVALVSNAATLVVQWVDPTPTGPAYVARYSAEYRVNGGASTQMTGLTSPSVNTTISAVAGNTVEVRYQAINDVVPSSPIAGSWSAWYSATQAVTPSNQNAPIFSLFAY